MQLGALEIDFISDGQVSVDAGGPFGLVPRVLFSASHPPDAHNRIPMALHCLLIRGAGRTILVDTGMGTKLTPKLISHWGLERNHGDLVAGLAALGIAPEDVDTVINSHLHGDHCGGNTRLDGETPLPTFPNARYWVQRIEWADACHPDARTRSTYDPRNFEPLMRTGQLKLLHGDTQVMDGVRCVVTPGHTSGHQCVVLESDGQSALFVADMATYAIQMAHTAWVTAYDVHPLETIATKERWQRWALVRNAQLLMQHDPITLIGRLRKESGRYEIETVLEANAA